jgi:hypothetical protein
LQENHIDERPEGHPSFGPTVRFPLPRQRTQAPAAMVAAGAAKSSEGAQVIPCQLLSTKLKTHRCIKWLQWFYNKRGGTVRRAATCRGSPGGGATNTCDHFGRVSRPARWGVTAATSSILAAPAAASLLHHHAGPAVHLRPRAPCGRRLGSSRRARPGSTGLP